MPELYVGQPVQIRRNTGLRDRGVGTITRISRRARSPITVQWGADYGDWSLYDQREIEPYQAPWAPGDIVRVRPCPVPESRVQHFAEVGAIGVALDDDDFEDTTLVEFRAGVLIQGIPVPAGGRGSQYVLNSELELVSAAEERFHDDDTDDTDEETGSSEPLSDLGYPLVDELDGPTVVQLETPMLDLIAEATARAIRADIGDGPDDRNPTEWVATLGARFGDIAGGAAEWSDLLACGAWARAGDLTSTMREDVVSLAADCLEFISAIDSQGYAPAGLDEATEHDRRNGPTRW